jgi:hypothetical protein
MAAINPRAMIVRFIFTSLKRKRSFDETQNGKFEATEGSKSRAKESAQATPLSSKSRYGARAHLSVSFGETPLTLVPWLWSA